MQTGRLGDEPSFSPTIRGHIFRSVFSTSRSGSVSINQATPPTGAIAEPSQDYRVASTETNRCEWRSPMDGIIYLVGLVVVVMAVLSLLGLR